MAGANTGSIGEPRVVATGANTGSAGGTKPPRH
jgi:hypothetical protein